MGSLACAKRFAVGPLNQFNPHLRHFAEAKDRIGGPCVAGDALPVKADALFQNPAGGLDCATLDLIDYAVGIDGFPDVDGDREPSDADVFSTFNLGDHGAIGAGILIARKAES